MDDIINNIKSQIDEQIINVDDDITEIFNNIIDGMNLDAAEIQNIISELSCDYNL